MPEKCCDFAQKQKMQLCKINEFLKNDKKREKIRKKCLQKGLIYYKIGKRGMTYDDVGGYQSQGVTDLRLISTENVRIMNPGGTVTVIGVLCPG